MSSLSRLKTSPGLLVRALVSLGAVAAIGGAVAAYTSGRTPLVADMTAQVLALVVIGALARRYGIPLPGNGFASYILGVVAYAVLDHGWPFALLVAPLAMLVGDLGLRRLPAAAALGDAAHLTAGSAVAGLVYQRLGGVVGTGALAAANLAPLAVFLAVLPATVNATYYLELALGRSLAWVDARLTARWETIVYACSAGLALVWLWLTHAGLEAGDALAVGGVLAITTMVSASVIRRAVRADELTLVQSLSQAIAADISLAKSFPRIQQLARRLVPWEQMGFARYDARTNEMELIADTAAGGGGGEGGRSPFRFDANAGLTGEAVRPAQTARPGGRRRGRRDARRRGRDGEDDGKGPPGDSGCRAPPRRPRRHHRGERARSAPVARRRRAGREVLGDHRPHRESDQPAGPERHDRGGARGRARPRLRGRGRRGSQARRGERA